MSVVTGTEQQTMLVRRARIGIILYAFCCASMSAADLFGRLGADSALFSIAVVRLAFFAAALGATFVRTDGTCATFALAASTLMLSGSALAMGMIRQELGIAVTVCTTILLAAAAFVAWGWHVQLFLTIATLCGFGALVFVSENPTALTQLILFGSGCSIASVYVARTYENTVASILRNSDEAEKWRQRFHVLNARLERRVTARTRTLKGATHSFEEVCERLANNIRSDVERLLDAQVQIENLSLARTPANSHLSRRAHAAAARMREILDALVDYVGLTQQPARAQSVNLSSLAQEITSEIEQRYNNTQVTVTIQPGLQVEADPELLRVALRELFDNSWKFATPNEPTLIELTCIDSSAGAVESGTPPTAASPKVYRLSDNGIGFSPAYASKLFHAFQRFHPDEAFPGLGMGLAKASRVIARHGGRIWAQSDVAQGTAVYFTLGQITQTNA